MNNYFDMNYTINFSDNLLEILFKIQHRIYEIHDLNCIPCFFTYDEAIDYRDNYIRKLNL